MKNEKSSLNIKNNLLQSKTRGINKERKKEKYKIWTSQAGTYLRLSLPAQPNYIKLTSLLKPKSKPVLSQQFQHLGRLDNLHRSA